MRVGIQMRLQNENITNSKLKVYPNLTNDKITFEFSQSDEYKQQIVKYDFACD